MSEVRRGSIAADIPAELPQELVEVLARGAGVRVERIVSRGHTSDWYDQDEDEFVLLVSGAARLEFVEREPVELVPGDWIDLPAHVRHRVAWTSEVAATVWLVVFRQPEQR